MNDSVRCEGFIAVDGKSLAGKIAERAAGFRDDQRGRSDVPRFEFQFPESVEPAAGDVAKVERRRAAPPNALAASEKPSEESQIEIGVLAPIVGEARGEQRLVQFMDNGGSDRGFIQRRALSFDRSEALAPQRIVDQSDNDLAAELDGDRNRDLRVAVREIRRAVERVDDPAVVLRLA